MNRLSTIFIILVVIGYLLYSQYSEKPVKGKKYVAVPIILIFIGYMNLKSLKGNISSDIPILSILCIIFLIIGIVSGKFIKFYRKDDGILYQKGGLISVLFLIGGIVIKEAFIAILSHTQYALLTHGGLLIVLLLGIQYGGRSIMIIYREPDVWGEYIQSRSESRR